MARTSAVDHVVAEMTEEKRIVDSCIETIGSGGPESLAARSEMLAACIVRLLGNGTEPAAPKPVRTRKSKKAQEPTL